MPELREPEFLSVEATADLLGVSSKHVRRLIDKGELAHHRFGRLIRIGRVDLDGYVASCRTQK